MLFSDDWWLERQNSPFYYRYAAPIAAKSDWKLDLPIMLFQAVYFFFRLFERLDVPYYALWSAKEGIQKTRLRHKIAAPCLELRGLTLAMRQNFTSRSCSEISSSVWLIVFEISNSKSKKPNSWFNSHFANKSQLIKLLFCLDGLYFYYILCPEKRPEMHTLLQVGY